MRQKKFLSSDAFDTLFRSSYGQHLSSLIFTSAGGTIRSYDTIVWHATHLLALTLSNRDSNFLLKSAKFAYQNMYHVMTELLSSIYPESVSGAEIDDDGRASPFKRIQAIFIDNDITLQRACYLLL